MILTKIISGGQTGTDRGALIAAKRLGVPTGGWMPRGFLAHDGYHPEFAALYDVRPTDDPGYAYRTRLNVRDSDATLRIARDFQSPGEICTLKAITALDRPHFDVMLQGPPGDALMIFGGCDPADVLMDWLNEIYDCQAIRGLWDQGARRGLTLNVAGNSERTCPGIQAFAEEFVGKLIEGLRP